MGLKILWKMAHLLNIRKIEAFDPEEQMLHFPLYCHKSDISKVCRSNQFFQHYKQVYRTLMKCSNSLDPDERATIGAL